MSKIYIVYGEAGGEIDHGKWNVKAYRKMIDAVGFALILNQTTSRVLEHYIKLNKMYAEHKCGIEEPYNYTQNNEMLELDKNFIMDYNVSYDVEELDIE